MSDAFISYRRKPSSTLAQLIKERFQNRHNISAYLDVSRADSTKVQFPERLMQAIADSPTFICLLADTTLDSEWVRKEITQAYNLKKHCIPVFQESYQPPTFHDDAVDYLLNFDGVKIFDLQNVFMDEAIDKIALLVVRAKKRRLGVLLAGVIATIATIAILLIVALTSQNNDPITTSEATTQVAQVTDDLTPNLEFFLAQTQTREAQLTELARPSNTPTETPNYNATLDTWASQTAAARPTNTPTIAPTNTSVPPPTLTAITPTIAPTKTPALSTIPPGYAGGANITANEQWIPVEQEFDGVTMVLVPKGCFMMGSTSASDEQPVHEQCFDEPFWIDKYEVTQAQFVQFGGQKANANYFTGDDLPVERITWFEARDYCQNNRGGRLPTEREWEYAARGPNNLIYPWGNEFIADNVVYYENSSRNGTRQTAPVGSREGGMSWVGAMDMSGNVWEWVGSLYQSYPYTANNEDINDNTSSRVLRGGSWSEPANIVRSAYRGRSTPSDGFSLIGFRCARSYNP